MTETPTTGAETVERHLGPLRERIAREWAEHRDLIREVEGAAPHDRGPAARFTPERLAALRALAAQGGSVTR